MQLLVWKSDIFTEQPQKHFSDAFLFLSSYFPTALLSLSIQYRRMILQPFALTKPVTAHCNIGSDGGGGQSNKSAESASYLDRLGAHMLMNKGYYGYCYSLPRPSAHRPYVNLYFPQQIKNQLTNVIRSDTFNILCKSCNSKPAVIQFNSFSLSLTRHIDWLVVQCLCQLDLIQRPKSDLRYTEWVWSYIRATLQLSVTLYSANKCNEARKMRYLIAFIQQNHIKESTLLVAVVLMLPKIRHTFSQYKTRRSHYQCTRIVWSFSE